MRFTSKRERERQLGGEARGPNGRSTRGCAPSPPGLHQATRLPYHTTVPRPKSARMAGGGAVQFGAEEGGEGGNERETPRFLQTLRSERSEGAGCISLPRRARGAGGRWAWILHSSRYINVILGAKVRVGRGRPDQHGATHVGKVIGFDPKTDKNKMIFPTFYFLDFFYFVFLIN